MERYSNGLCHCHAENVLTGLNLDLENHGKVSVAAMVN